MIKDAIIISAMNDDEAESVCTQLFDYNMKISPSKQEPRSIPVRLVIKKDNEMIIGGLIGKIYRFALSIEILWIDEAYRKQGYGDRLLSRAEEIAKENYCGLIHLDTFSFQAPVFYQNNGFEIFGVLDGYTEGVKRYYLKKII